MVVGLEVNGVAGIPLEAGDMAGDQDQRPVAEDLSWRPPTGPATGRLSGELLRPEKQEAI